MTAAGLRRSTGSSRSRPSTGRPSLADRQRLVATRRRCEVQFDQQPIEATALLLAAESAVIASRASLAIDAAMERAYAWFLGANDLGVAVADPRRGACRDGLTPDGVNLNEGAESTLMWLTAAEHIRALRAAERSTTAARCRPQLAASRGARDPAASRCSSGAIRPTRS